MKGEQVREIRGLIRGHLEEIASSLQYEATKNPADIDTTKLENLKKALEIVIQGVNLFQDGFYDEKYGMEYGQLAISKLREIQW